MQEDPDALRIPQKVLIVSGDFVKTGGMDRANHGLAYYLAQNNVETHLVAFRVSSDLLAFPNVVFHRIPKPKDSYSIGSLLMDPYGRYWARRIQRAGGIVIVNGGNCNWPDVNWTQHVNSVYEPAVEAAPIGKLRAKLMYRYYCKTEQAYVPRARLVLTSCRKTGREIVETLATPAAKVHHVYYGIDPRLFRPFDEEAKQRVRAERGWARDRPLLVFVGALGDRRKGFDTLFESFRMLCADRSFSPLLVVIGGGGEVTAWQRRAAEAGIAERVQFLGFLRNVPEILGAFDAMVMPSRYEGYSLTTQEALCCGIPAFITKSAGIAERYPADLGELLISDPNDPVELAQRLKNWLGRRDEFARRVASFGAELRAYTWDHMARDMMRIILDERRSRGA
jgi:glycosyltransferase involved in cell wall biosynthesis